MNSRLAVGHVDEIIHMLDIIDARRDRLRAGLGSSMHRTGW